MSRVELDLPIEGMTCASCATSIERRLDGLEGVEATVNYATELAHVSYDAERVELGDLTAAVEQAGYRARPTGPDEPREPGDDPAGAALAALRRRLIAAALLTLPVLALSMIPALQFDNWQWLVLQLATPVILWAGWPFHVAAWRNLRHATATMDTLVSLGTLAAWTWSVVALFFGDAGMTGMTMSIQLIRTARRASARSTSR